MIDWRGHLTVACETGGAFWKQPHWDSFWAEVNVPDAGATPYLWGKLFIGHHALGAMCAALVVLIVTGLHICLGLPLWLVYITALLTPLYWASKEVLDRRQGGSLFDSYVDTYGVTTGLWSVLILPPEIMWKVAVINLLAAAFAMVFIDRQLRAIL